MDGCVLYTFLHFYKECCRYIGSENCRSVWYAKYFFIFKLFLLLELFIKSTKFFFKKVTSDMRALKKMTQVRVDADF